jgi:hypothetical protein
MFRDHIRRRGRLCESCCRTLRECFR